MPRFWLNMAVESDNNDDDGRSSVRANGCVGILLLHPPLNVCVGCNKCLSKEPNLSAITTILPTMAM